MNERLSLLVSHILDNLGYNEEIRQYRVDMYDHQNFVCGVCSNRTAMQNMLAGSKAEGTSAYFESDFDHLHIYSGVNATECEDIIEDESELTLYMDGNGVPPGYCKIQLLQDGRENVWHGHFADTDCYVPCPGYHRPYLSSTFVLQMIHEHLPPGRKICGPAHSGADPGGADTDRVPAIRCSDIPSSYKLWIRSHQHSVWPNKKVMEQIVNADVFLVPTGKHGSEDQFLQWRISFNVPEKILIQNFTSLQYKVHILLKMAIKEVIQPQCPESITSYIVKTIMLWAVEDIPAEEWRNEKLVELLLRMMDRLLACVQCGVCCMYFIPEDNILEGRINKVTQGIVCNILTSLLDDRIKCVLSLPRIAEKVYQFNMRLLVHVPLPDYTLVTTREKAAIQFESARKLHAHSLYITDRVNLLCCLQEHSRIPYNDLLTDLVSEITAVQSEREKSVKYIFSLTLSQLAIQNCVDVISGAGTNIQKYNSVRQCVKLLNSHIHADVLCGRVNFAQVVYMLGQYKTALSVLKDGASRVRYYMNNTSQRYRMQKNRPHVRLRKAVGYECLSSPELLKQFTSSEVHFDHQKEYYLPNALQYELYRSQKKRYGVRVDSEVCLPYLQYLCYTQVGKTRYADEVFKNFVRRVTRNESNIEYREVGLNVLGHCLLKKGLYDQAARVLIKSVMLRKQFPHLDNKTSMGVKNNAAYYHLAILLNKLYKRNSSGL